MRLYVYFDEKYPTSWISKDVGAQIVKYLENKGFIVVDANELKRVIEESIRKPGEETTIVFAQDVVPAVVIDNPSNPTANSLLRRFLNVGHTIVWLGDAPLYNIGFEDGKRQSIPNACQSVLGVTANVLNVQKPVGLTFYADLYGLPKWRGMRPHASISTNIVSVNTALALSIHGNQIVYHGFIVSYVGDTFSGFIRIYDFVMNKPLPDEYLEALYRIATIRNPLELLFQRMNTMEKTLKDLKELLETKYSTLKSELDNLRELLEKFS